MAETSGPKERERAQARALSRLLAREAAWLAGGDAGAEAAAAARAARGLAWLEDLAGAFDARRARAYFAALTARTSEPGASASGAWHTLGAPFCARLAGASARGRGFDALDDDALDWEPHVLGVRAFEEPPPVPEPAPEPHPAPAPAAEPAPDPTPAIFLAVAAFAGEREPTFSVAPGRVVIEGALPAGGLDAAALATLDHAARAEGAVVVVREGDDGAIAWRVVVQPPGEAEFVFVEGADGPIAVPAHRVVDAAVAADTARGGGARTFGHGLRRAALPWAGDAIPAGLASSGETRAPDGRVAHIVDVVDEAATLAWLEPLADAAAPAAAPPAAPEPLQAPPVPADNPDDAARPPAFAPAGGHAAPRRALVADDSVMARVFLSRLLAAEGIAVEVADNGDDARALLAAGGFDLAFLDVDMPGGGALEIAHELAGADAVAGVGDAGAPPIVCALVKDDAERERVEASGLGLALFKPFAEDEVHAALAAFRAAREPNP